MEQSENIQHYEQLWEAAESIVNKLYGTIDSNAKSQLLIQEINNIISILEEMKKIPLHYDGLMYRKMGQLLFKLTQVSFLTNVNTYTALRDEMKYQEIEAFKS